MNEEELIELIDTYEENPHPKHLSTFGSELEREYDSRIASIGKNLLGDDEYEEARSLIRTLEGEEGEVRIESEDGEVLEYQ